MIHVLLIGPRFRVHLDVENFFQKHDDVKVSKVLSRWRALDLMAQQHYDLAIIDEFVGQQTGIELAESLVPLEPMMNMVLINPLPPDRFHEVTEGMGILAQLSLQPSEEELEKMLTALRSILVRMD